MTKRMKANARREQILDGALAAAGVWHYTKLTRAQIAEMANVSEGLITHHFGTMAKLQRDIMRHAIRTENLRVIAQGLTVDDPHARRAPLELRQRALARV